MKSRSIGGVVVDAVPATAVEVAVAEEVAGAPYADDAADADIAVGVDCAAWCVGAGLCVLTGALGAALGGATGAGSVYAGLAEAAVMEAGAIGGSSDRSWRESSGSGMSSNAATECVGAIGAGAGATSDWSEIADVDCVATDDGSADGSRLDSEPVLAVEVVADFAHRPDVDAVPVAVGAAEGATPVGAIDAGAADVGDAGAATDVGVGARAGADPVGTPGPAAEAPDVG